MGIEAKDTYLKRGKIFSSAQVMMEMQVPIKKIYLTHRNNITKEMVDELLEMIKSGNSNYEECRFLKEFKKMVKDPKQLI